MKLLLILSALMAFASFAKADDSTQCQLVNNQYTAACAAQLTKTAQSSEVVSLLVQAYAKQYKTTCTIIADVTKMTTTPEGASPGVVQYDCQAGLILQITGEATITAPNNAVSFTVSKTETSSTN